MTSILMICTGNICRSPLAAALLRSELERHGLNHMVVSSAGTGAWDGTPASEGAYLVALEHDVDLSEHRAQLVTRDIVAQADLILTMTRHQRSRVEELGGEGRAHVLGEFVGRSGPEAEVGDPFGAELEVYRETFDELSELIRLAAERLLSETNDQD